jgi:DNA-binding transcriptional ArsR family regulator
MRVWQDDDVEKNHHRESMKKKNLEKMLKALANRRRLAMLAYLKEAKKANVNAVAKELRVSAKTASRNLVILERAGIVEKEPWHQHVIYRLTKSPRPFVNDVFLEI